MIMPFRNIKRQKAFTLSEVLITLAIIGVVASMTIPALTNNMEKADLVTGFKKGYTSLSSAAKMSIVNNGSIMGALKGDTHNDLMNAMCENLSCTKKCLEGQSGCWHNTYKDLYGDIPAWLSGYNYATSVLADGMLVKFRLDDVTCKHDRGDGPLDKKACGQILIDVNGFKSPNVLGRDVFAFYIIQSGIYPFGSSIATNWNSTSACEPTYQYFSSGNGYSGLGCASKILKEGGMNY